MRKQHGWGVRRRWLVLGTCLALVAACGLLCSGWLVLALLGLDEVPLRWNTYLDYVSAVDLPRVRPYATRIRMAGILGVVATITAALPFVVLATRRPAQALHGDARFATRREACTAGLLGQDGTGLVVGTLRRELLYLRGQQFAIVAAPTRSGKGTGIVIPNLLSYAESVVVLDIKQENFALTSGWRSRQGQQVYLFNPFADDHRSHRWNPLTYVSADPAMRVADLQSIATLLYPDAGSEQKFWVSQARNAFIAFALYLFGKQAEDQELGFPAATVPTLGAVFRLSTPRDGAGLRAHVDGLSRRSCVPTAAADAFANLLSQADETFASIMGSLKEPLNAWINPVLDAATSGDDFDLRDLRRRPISIYIGVMPGKLAESRLILNLFFSQLINVNTTTLPGTDPMLKHQCLLLMDEFTSIGKLEILPTAIAYMAGYNLRLLPIIQSMAQLDAVYGKEDARTILTNHALQVVFTPREQRDANEYSEMLGYRTMRRQSVTRGRDVSRTDQLERRALMLPQELKAMDNARQIILYEGLEHPLACDKIRYFRDPRFTPRLFAPCAVPDLRLVDRNR